MSSSKIEQQLTIVSSALLFLAPILSFLYFRRGSSCKTRPPNHHHDDYYLQRAHQLRLALTPPRLSQFRVVALFLLDNQQIILGTNDEPSPTISGAICAERAALLQYRLQYGQHQQTNSKRPPQVTTVYIVTDAPQPVPPGTLCREYMYGHEAFSTAAAAAAASAGAVVVKLVLQSADPTSSPLVTTLQELYPYPCVYTGKTRTQQVELAQNICTNMTTTMPSLETVSAEQVQQLYRAAYQRAKQQQQDNHSNDELAFAAAALLSNGSIVTAVQVPTLEYGATQDALCQLWSAVAAVQQQQQQQPQQQQQQQCGVVKLLMHVDALGVAHPPFAPARSVWVEHGCGQVPIVFHTTVTGDECCWKVMLLHQLAPMVPEFR